MREVAPYVEYPSISTWESICELVRKPNNEAKVTELLKSNPQTARFVIQLPFGRIYCAPDGDCFNHTLLAYNANKFDHPLPSVTQCSDVCSAQRIPFCSAVELVNDYKHCIVLLKIPGNNGYMASMHACIYVRNGCCVQPAKPVKQKKIPILDCSIPLKQKKGAIKKMQIREFNTRAEAIKKHKKGVKKFRNSCRRFIKKVTQLALKGEIAPVNLAQCPTGPAHWIISNRGSWDWLYPIYTNWCFNRDKMREKIAAGEIQSNLEWHQNFWAIPSIINIADFRRLLWRVDPEPVVQVTKVTSSEWKGIVEDLIPKGVKNLPVNGRVHMNSILVLTTLIINSASVEINSHLKSWLDEIGDVLDSGQFHISSDEDWYDFSDYFRFHEFTITRKIAAKARRKLLSSCHPDLVNRRIETPIHCKYVAILDRARDWPRKNDFQAYVTYALWIE